MGVVVQTLLGTSPSQDVKTHERITGNFPFVSEVDLDWDKHPVLIRVRIGEEELVNLGYVWPILKGENRKPSVVAKLTPPLDQTIILIDEMYDSALQTYKGLVRNACIADKALIQGTLQPSSPSQNGNGRGRAVKAVVGAINGIVRRSSLSTEESLSLNRSRRISDVANLEKARLTRTEFFIKQRAIKLVTDLAALEANSRTSREKASGLWQIFNVYLGLFGEDMSIQIPSSNELVDVSDFLHLLTTKFDVLKNLK